MKTPIEGVILVTGASSGIGEAAARLLAARADVLVLVARREDRLTALAAELKAAYPRCRVEVRPCDLTDGESARALVADVITVHGRIDVLVNNAGTAPSMRFEVTGDEVLDHVLALHVRAPFRLARGVVPAMRAAGSGVIVQVASTAGLRGFAFTAAYGMAKHAMVGLARALRAELGGTRIRAYAVCPGFVDTEITRSAAAAIAARGNLSPGDALAKLAQLNRIGRMHAPDEVAAAVVRLVGERPDGCVLDLDQLAPTIEP